MQSRTTQRILIIVVLAALVIGGVVAALAVAGDDPDESAVEGTGQPDAEPDGDQPDEVSVAEGSGGPSPPGGGAGRRQGRGRRRAQWIRDRGRHVGPGAAGRLRFRRRALRSDRGGAGGRQRRHRRAGRGVRPLRRGLHPPERRAGLRLARLRLRRCDRRVGGGELLGAALPDRTDLLRTSWRASAPRTTPWRPAFDARGWPTPAAPTSRGGSGWSGITKIRPPRRPPTRCTASCTRRSRSRSRSSKRSAPRTMRWPQRSRMRASPTHATSTSRGGSG